MTRAWLHQVQGFADQRIPNQSLFENDTNPACCANLISKTCKNSRAVVAPLRLFEAWSPLHLRTEKTLRSCDSKSLPIGCSHFASLSKITKITQFCHTAPVDPTPLRARAQSSDHPTVVRVVHENEDRGWSDRNAKYQENPFLGCCLDPVWGCAKWTRHPSSSFVGVSSFFRFQAILDWNMFVASTEMGRSSERGAQTETWEWLAVN